MIKKPLSCGGCPLEVEGEGFLVNPSLPSKSGVLLLGESLNEEEAKTGTVGIGRAGFMLTRLLQWAGLNRDDFAIFTSAWCRPPSNKLDGTPYETPAVSHCKQAHWNHLLAQYNVIVPMGNVPLAALTGRKGILATRGYVRSGPFNNYILPTIAPNFIIRGQSRYASAFINDVRKAVELSQNGLPVEFADYNHVDMLPATALDKVRNYRQQLLRNPTLPLAVDIETPYADADESERGEDDSWNIERISLSWGPHQAISLPYTGPYMAAIRLALDASGPMVTWNGDNFDNPRLRASGHPLNRPLFDAMIAWHVLHSDLPKSLGFVATFTCPWQPEWKHKSKSEPVYYSCVDADVTWRSFDVIQSDLKGVPGLWEAYDRDVLQLNPILRKMEAAGMPIDYETRLDRASKLTVRLAQLEEEIGKLVPAELRKVSPEKGYIKTPSDTSQLVEIEVEVEVKRCGRCGIESPTKPHFRVLKKPTAKRPQNPCAGATPVVGMETKVRWAAQVPWKASSKALIEYQLFHNRTVFRKYDKKSGERKPSMDKKALKKCLGKYPDDPLYGLILQYREIQTIGSRYIGYVEEQ